SFYLNHGLLYGIFFPTITGKVLPAQHLYIYHIGIPRFIIWDVFVPKKILPILFLGHFDPIFLKPQRNL
ncbi:hypothetical protein, partial [Bilophila wadsworthia]|uniref:hypothetical protein n=1 Tax=Bilophila wadsworthia TaxID=35833 RepID=UPI00307CAF14